MSPTTTTPITRGDRIALVALAGITAALGLMALVGGVLRLRLYALAVLEGTAPLSLLTDTSVPGVPSEGTPRIVAGVFPTADLLVEGLDAGTLALLATGEALAALVAVVVSGGIAWLLLSIARSRPFARSLPTSAVAAGATLSIGSLLAQAVAGFGRMNAAHSVNEAAGDELFFVGFDFDPLPVALGLAIMALAFVFRAGARLERDTEGLV